MTVAVAPKANKTLCWTCSIILVCVWWPVKKSRPANLESKKILRFLYLYCIAVCSKKKTGRCYAETKKKKKKKGLDFLNLKSMTFALQTVRFYPTKPKVSETVRVSRPQKP